MMKRFTSVASVLFVSCLMAKAAVVDIVLTVTNTPLGAGATNITVNGVTRYWTNVTGPLTILTNLAGTFPKNGAATNLFLAFGSFGQAGVSVSQTNTNTLVFRGSGLTVAVAGNWASLGTNSTASTNLSAVYYPWDYLSLAKRTNQTDEILWGLSEYGLTNRFKTNSMALSNYVSAGLGYLGGTQAVYGPKWFWSLAGTNGSKIYQGEYWYPTNVNPVISNGINYGNAFRSDGAGSQSLQIGSNALANATRAIAIGANSIATNTDSITIGTGASATNQDSVSIGNASVGGWQAISIGVSTVTGDDAIAIGYTAVGSGTSGTALGSTAEASGLNSTAIGAGTVANETGSSAFGFGANGVFNFSTAIGYLATTTATNQIRLGRVEDYVSVLGRIEAGSVTNAVLRGTNTINGRVDFTSRANTALADGNNAGVILGTNVYIRLSGATTIATICGFAAEQDGSFHVVEISGAVTNYLANASGTDPAAANRIITGTGGDIFSTNNPAMLTIIYNATASRWRVVSYR